MALASLSPFLSPLSSLSLSHQALKQSPPPPSSLFLFVTRNPFFSSPSSSTARHSIPNSNNNDSVSSESSSSSFLNEELLRRVSAAKDADQAFDMVVEANGGVVGGEIGNEDCRAIIAAAIDRGNVELGLSVFHAMRAALGQGMSEKISDLDRWSWARPDVRTCSLLVQGLAASLRVSDAIMIITYVSRVGISLGAEVPFGMIVRCPICSIAVAVAQPQQGIQVASCSKCRYQYQLVSGDVMSIDSEVISMDNSAWRRAMTFLKISKGDNPAALHSIVVRTPSGVASTHKFATETVELPAQEGERVTISLAAPSDIFRGTAGLIKLIPRAPGMSPGEPMCLTNHSSGQVSQVLRAPAKDERSFLFNPSILFPALTLLATGDAASGIIDPTLPRLISIVAVASVALEAAVNRIILPELRKLPQRTVDVVALKQQLLSQYDLLQTCIKDLRQAAEKEVWMLARMYQLENKIVAVGEPSYRARRARVKRVRESLENSLLSRIELIESYAKISSMIEIEVEMDSDVLAAEAESIAEQIQQMMEIENLQERWRIQAEANDEVERLLNSQPMSSELV
ncbi:uncharacterized protein LOC109834380 isoform X2 [Asparagus officinalis]|uniref:uncharacterized protein LOC109834380 isoform X2 n=1 Tax=Asparagus officinalis TaxID=4686 RepID=UPI00098E3D8E|nr:uncharacterized protein LOC109834380 isoform X2 [Asparagus officinalis]